MDPVRLPSAFFARVIETYPASSRWVAFACALQVVHLAVTLAVTH